MTKGKNSVRGFLIVLLALLDDIIVLALVVLALRWLGVEITPLVIFLLLALLVGYFFLIHRAIVPHLYQRRLTGAEGMIGLQGSVVEAPRPTGVVKVGCEYWKARSADTLAIGEVVEVTGVKALTLEVRRKRTVK